MLIKSNKPKKKRNKIQKRSPSGELSEDSFQQSKRRRRRKLQTKLLDLVKDSEMGLRSQRSLDCSDSFGSGDGGKDLKLSRLEQKELIEQFTKHLILKKKRSKRRQGSRVYNRKDEETRRRKKHRKKKKMTAALERMMDQFIDDDFCLED